MPTSFNETYISKDGDTFKKVSLSVYGVETYEDVIRDANVGIIEPMAANLFVKLPLLGPAPFPDDFQAAPVDLPQPGRLTSVPFENVDEVTLLIEGVNFKHWDMVSLTRSIDSFSTVNFTAPFEPDDPAFRKLFVPLSYALIQVFVGGQPFFFGRILSVQPQVMSDKRMITIQCYSYAATVNDCTKTLNTEPNFNGLPLLEITKRLLRPFAIRVISPSEDQDNSDLLEPFNETAIVNKKIFKYLSGLAGQRDYVITDNSNGDFVYQRAIESGQPVANLVEGLSPMESITCRLNAQNWFSDVTGAMVNTMSTKGEGVITEKNPFLPNVFRPFYFGVTDVDTTVKEAVKSKFARMLADVVAYTVEVNSWRDSNGDLFTHNTFIDITAPGAMVYEKYRFLVSGVVLKATAEKRSAILSLSVPGSFTGEPPETLPWA